MCLTLSPCGFAGSRSETGSSLRMFVYLLCSVFSRLTMAPRKTVSLGNGEMECLESAGHSSQAAFGGRVVLPVNKNGLQELDLGRHDGTGYVALRTVQLCEPVCTEALMQNCWALGPEQM